MPEIAVQGENVHFQDTVKALPRTIVFLHGAGGSHHTWRDQWAELKGTARIVVPDLPGHGGSGGGPKESIEAYAAWTREFAREAGIGKFVLAGHSMGGAVALQAALNGIPGLEALILAGTGAKLKVSPVILEGIASRFREFAPELVEWMMARATGTDLREDVTKDILSTRAATYAADFKACDAFDVRERIGAIRVPALLLFGDDDRLTPLRYGEYLARNLPGAVLKIIRDAGHVAMLEKAAEVNGAIRSFIRSLD